MMSQLFPCHWTEFHKHGGVQVQVDTLIDPFQIALQKNGFILIEFYFNEYKLLSKMVQNYWSFVSWKFFLKTGSVTNKDSDK